METSLSVFLKRVSEGTTTFKIFGPLCNQLEGILKRFINSVSESGQTLNTNKTLSRAHVEHGIRKVLSNENLLNTFMTDAGNYVDLFNRYNTEIKQDKEQGKEFYNNNYLNIIPRVKKIVKHFNSTMNIGEEGVVYFTGLVLALYKYILTESVVFTTRREEKKAEKTDRKTSIIADDYKRALKANTELSTFLGSLATIEEPVEKIKVVKTNKASTASTSTKVTTTKTKTPAVKTKTTPAKVVPKKVKA